MSDQRRLPPLCRWLGHKPNRIDDTRELDAFSVVVSSGERYIILQRNLIGHFCPRCMTWVHRPDRVGEA